MNHRTPVTAIYPGSFDPITLGHEDIARRALRLCERLIVAVAHTATHEKSALFPVQERVALLAEVFGDDERIRCESFQGLLVDYARRREARLIIRGLRAVSDFEYEFQMAQMNQELWQDIETVFLAPDVHYSFLSASLVREVASLRGDVSPFVSAPVLARLQKKFSG